MICSQCKIDKPSSDFYLRGDRNGPRSACKNCMGWAARKRLEFKCANEGHSPQLVSRIEQWSLLRKGFYTCCTCREVKAIREFHKSNQAKSGISSRCKECCSKWHKAHPKNQQNQKLKKCYGFSLAEKEDMIQRQRNACAVCFSTFSNSKDTHVDHDHMTGAVRGILCRRCNLVLGLFRDSPILFQQAVVYLSRTVDTQSVP